MRKALQYLVWAASISHQLDMYAAEVDGRAVAFACLGCHSVRSEQEDRTDVGKMATMSAEILAGALLDFKYDRRSSTVMGRIAKGYADRELIAAAAYLGKR